MSTGIANTQGQRRPSRPHASGGGPSPGVGGKGNAQSRKAQKLLMDESQLSQLGSNIESMNFYVNHGYLASISQGIVQRPEALPTNRNQEIAVFELSQLMLNEGEDTYEKLISVYASLNTCVSSMGFLINSDRDRVRFYLCAVHPNGKKQNGKMFQNSIQGHFPGSKLRELTDPEIDSLLNGISQMPGMGSPANRFVRSLSVVPSRREQEQQNHSLKLSSQGIEKFVDALRGKEYSLLLLAEAVSGESLEHMKSGMEALYTLMSPFARENVSFAETESDATTYSLSTNLSTSISKSISKTYGVSTTTGTGTSRGGSQGSSANGQGFGFSSGSCWGQSTSQSKSISTGDSESNAKVEAEGKAIQTGDSHTIGTTRTLSLTREVKTVQNCMARLDAEIARI